MRKLGITHVHCLQGSEDLDMDANDSRSPLVSFVISFGKGLWKTFAGIFTVVGVVLGFIVCVVCTVIGSIVVVVHTIALIIYPFYEIPATSHPLWTLALLVCGLVVVHLAWTGGQKILDFALGKKSHD